ncbi:hypothetical protein FRC11_007349 [Ceratobasidium sp. 423]|nr:hypothetical protein FRC11_007349 [Ceratobasidium sp. 423]
MRLQTIAPVKVDTLPTPGDSGSNYTISSNADADKKRIPPIHAKRTRHPQQTVQGLGVVHPFTEAVNSDRDNEEAVLLQHCQHCEAYGQPPTFDLLEKLFRRCKGKKGRPRKRQKDEDEEPSKPEDERLEDMGGWIRCLRCCVHENEVAKVEKHAEGIEIADDAELVDKRKQIWLDEATKFICGQCSKGGRCIVCKEETASRPAPIPGQGSSAANAINLDTPPPEKANQSEATPEPPKETSEPPSKPSPLGAREAGFYSVVLPAGVQRTGSIYLPGTQRTRNKVLHHKLLELTWNLAQSNGNVTSVLCSTQVSGREHFGLAARPARGRGGTRMRQNPKAKGHVAERVPRQIQGKGDGTKLELLEDDSEEYLEKIGKMEQADDKGKGKATAGGALDVLPVFACPRSISVEGDTKSKPEDDETPGPTPDAQLCRPNSWRHIDRVLDILLHRPRPRTLS